MHGHFCKGLSVRHLVRPFENGCQTAFGLPKSFQEGAGRAQWIRATPPSPGPGLDTRQRTEQTGLCRGQTAQEFESGAVPESVWPDGGICKCARSQGKRCRNGKKRLQAGRNAQPLHNPLPSCTTLFLAGIEPATYGS